MVRQEESGRGQVQMRSGRSRLIEWEPRAFEQLLASSDIGFLTCWLPSSSKWLCFPAPSQLPMIGCGHEGGTRVVRWLVHSPSPVMKLRTLSRLLGRSRR